MQERWNANMKVVIVGGVAGGVKCYTNVVTVVANKI